MAAVAGLAPQACPWTRGAWAGAALSTSDRTGNQEGREGAVAMGGGDCKGEEDNGGKVAEMPSLVGLG